MSKPIFKLEHVEGYSIIDKPCTAIVRASSDYHYLTKGKDPRYLIGLRVIREEDIDTLKKRIGYGINKTVDFDFISDLIVGGAVFKDNITNELELPTKGEELIASFGYINDRLLCTHISLLTRERLKTVSLERLSRTQSLFETAMKNKNILEND